MSRKSEHIPFAISLGTDLKFVSSFPAMFQLNVPAYDFLLSPLVHPFQYRTAAIDLARGLPLTYSGNYFC